MYIDLKNAKKELKKYVETYDCNNEKIKLKIKHTFKVMQMSKKLASKLKLSQEDIEIASLIGLLHDIGRFEQIKQYNTFSDIDSVNHGELGVKILFENNLIRRFVKEEKYDEIIKTAIMNHNLKSIQSGLNEKELLHCKIIRDADKIDIFRILNEEQTQQICGYNNIEDQLISDEILTDFFKQSIIDYSKIKTDADRLVYHIAYIFDCYFNYSLSVIKDKKYIEKLIKNVNFKNEQTIQQINEILKCANEYMNSKF